MLRELLNKIGSAFKVPQKTTEMETVEQMDAVAASIEKDINKARHLSDLHTVMDAILEFRMTFSWHLRGSKLADRLKTLYDVRRYQILEKVDPPKLG